LSHERLHGRELLVLVQANWLHDYSLPATARCMDELLLTDARSSKSNDIFRGHSNLTKSPQYCHLDSVEAPKQDLANAKRQRKLGRHWMSLESVRCAQHCSDRRPRVTLTCKTTWTESARSRCGHNYRADQDCVVHFALWLPPSAGPMGVPGELHWGLEIQMNVPRTSIRNKDHAHPTGMRPLQ
jgi:hypothetical protein